MAEAQQASRTWLSTFDDLTALPNGRVAVFVYVLLSGLAFLAGVAIVLPMFNLAQTYLPILDTRPSTTQFGIGFNVDFGGMILTLLIGVVWLQAMRVVRKIAVWVGGKTKEVSQ